ncbi:MAG: DsbA family protein [Aestuariivirga sp.]|nr:DsbA family protein [Aestuariivirga sp.]
MITPSRRQFTAVLVGAGLASHFSAIARAASSSSDAELEKALMGTVPVLGERSMGNVNASVVMIEYASLTCTNSAEFNAVYWPSIKADFVDTGKVRFIFREFPLDNLAMRAFMILRCVPEDRYFSTLDLILNEQKTWRGKDAMTELARLMQANGMNEQEFQACANDRRVAKAIFETQQANMKQFGFKSTPTFFVAGRKLDGKTDPASIRPAIEASLAKV